MKQKSALGVAALERQFEQLREQLLGGGYVSQGSVQTRTGRSGGRAGYQWTRKVAAKTVTVALTQQEYEQLGQAIKNYRELRKILALMEQVSRKIIFQSSPHPGRRKRLSAKVLGTN